MVLDVLVADQMNFFIVYFKTYWQPDWHHCPLSLGGIQILNMSNNVSLLTRVLFGLPDKSLWPTKYYNFKLSATSMSGTKFQCKDGRYPSAINFSISTNERILALFQWTLMPMAVSGGNQNIKHVKHYLLAIKYLISRPFLSTEVGQPINLPLLTNYFIDIYWFAYLISYICEICRPMEPFL